jgi:hypothetical protein
MINNKIDILLDLLIYREFFIKFKKNSPIELLDPQYIRISKDGKKISYGKRK